jgi:hypothetical protein
VGGVFGHPEPEARCCRARAGVKVVPEFALTARFA